MALVLVEFDVVGQLAHFSIDPHPGKTFGGQPTDQFGVGALLATHNRSKQLIPRGVRQGEDLIDHFINGLRPDWTITPGAMRIAGPTEQQTQIILDLRDGSDSRTWVVTGGFLIDRDRRGKALNGINIRLVDLTQKLTRVSGKTLDVATLTLSKNGVESQGAFTATAHPCEHHHLVARDGEINVLEIVLASTTNADHVLF